MKKFIIIVLTLLASIYPLYADSGGSSGTLQDEESIETMVAVSVKYWNRNFETLKENSVYSKLISQFGDANVVVTIAPTNEIVGIDFEDGKIVGYYIGGEILDSTVDVNLQMSTFKNVFYADDPTPAFLAAYKNGEIEMEGRTISTKALLSVTGKLKTLIPSDSSDEKIISEGSEEPVQVIKEEVEIIPQETGEENIKREKEKPKDDKPTKNNFRSSVSKFIAGVLGLFGR